MALNEVILVSLPNELTLSSVEVFEPPLQAMAREGRRIVLDLSRVTIMSTPGIGLLLETHRAAQQAGGSMVIARASTRIIDLIHRTQLHRILTLTPTLDAAVDALQS